MSDKIEERTRALAQATEAIAPSSGFAARVAAAIAARPLAEGWPGAFAWIARRASLVGGAAALAGVALAALDVHGLRVIDDLLVRVIAEVVQ